MISLYTCDIFGLYSYLLAASGVGDTWRWMRATLSYAELQWETHSKRQAAQLSLAPALQRMHRQTSLKFLVSRPSLKSHQCLEGKASSIQQHFAHWSFLSKIPQLGEHYQS